MLSYLWSTRQDEPTFVKGDRPNVYYIGRFMTAHMPATELHQLRLAIDAVDDIVNGPMK